MIKSMHLLKFTAALAAFFVSGVCLYAGKEGDWTRGSFDGLTLQPSPLRGLVTSTPRPTPTGVSTGGQNTGGWLTGWFGGATQEPTAEVPTGNMATGSTWLGGLGTALYNAVTFNWFNWGTETPVAQALTEQQAFLRSFNYLLGRHPFPENIIQGPRTQLIPLIVNLEVALRSYLIKLQEAMEKGVKENPEQTNANVANLMQQSMFFVDEIVPAADDSKREETPDLSSAVINAIYELMAQAVQASCPVTYGHVHTLILEVFNLMNPMGEGNIRVSEDWTGEQGNFEVLYPVDYQYYLTQSQKQNEQAEEPDPQLVIQVGDEEQIDPVGAQGQEGGNSELVEDQSVKQGTSQVSSQTGTEQKWQSVKTKSQRRNEKKRLRKKQARESSH